MASVRFNDLSRIQDSESQALLRDFASILDSGCYLNGPYSERLKTALQDRFSCASVTLVGNGTDALRLALLALGVTQGSRVVTVANAGGYATGATLSLGGIPVLVDVRNEDAQMDPDSLAAVVESPVRPTAIVVTHLYGQMAPMPDIMAIASRAGIPVIEDIAQAFGSAIPQGQAGSFGSMATASFYPTKNLGSVGDAGAVLAKTEELGNLCASLAQYGWGERYVVEQNGGFNSRMDEIHAATLCRRINEIDKRNLIRRGIFQRLCESTSGNRRFIGSSDRSFVAHLAVMKTPHRVADRAFLSSNGVATGVHYPLPDHLQPAWRGLIETPVALPCTESLSKEVLSIPCFPSMTRAEVDHVANALAALSDG